MKQISLVLMIIFPSIASAGVDCSERVNHAILHQNGNVYFTTDKTCPNWCQIKWTNDGDKDRAYSTLLAARVTQKNMTFYWASLNSCDDKNATYTSPSYMVF